MLILLFTQLLTQTYNFKKNKFITMKKLFTIFTVNLLFAGITANAQVKIGLPSGAPAASAILDLSNLDAAATAKKGFLGPQVTLSGTADATTVPSPATGLMVYNTTAAGSGTTAVVAGYYYFNGTQWVQMVSSAAPASGNIYTADGTLTGNRTVSMGTNALNFTGASGININTTSSSVQPLNITQPLQPGLGQPAILISGASGTPATNQASLIGLNPNASQGAFPIVFGAQYVNGSASQAAADFIIAASSGGGLNTRFVVQNGGNVGIGTTTPVTKLDVAGALGFNGATANGQLRSTVAGVLNLNVGNSSLNIDKNDGSASLMNIVNSTGNVGIGATAPGAKLELAGTGNLFSAAAIFNNTTATTGRKFSIGSRSDVTNGTGQSGTFVIADETAGLPRVTLDQAGNVGIGISSPTVTLDVNGQARIRNVPTATATSNNFALVVDGNGNVQKTSVQSGSASLKLILIPQATATAFTIPVISNNVDNSWDITVTERDACAQMATYKFNVLGQNFGGATFVGAGNMNGGLATNQVSMTGTSTTKTFTSTGTLPGCGDGNSGSSDAFIITFTYTVAGANTTISISIKNNQSAGPSTHDYYVSARQLF